MFLKKCTGIHFLREDLDAVFPWGELWMHVQWSPNCAIDKMEGVFGDISWS